MENRDGGSRTDGRLSFFPLSLCVAGCCREGENYAVIKPSRRGPATAGNTHTQQTEDEGYPSALLPLFQPHDIFLDAIYLYIRSTHTHIYIYTVIKFKPEKWRRVAKKEEEEEMKRERDRPSATYDQHVSTSAAEK